MRLMVAVCLLLVITVGWISLPTDEVVVTIAGIDVHKDSTRHIIFYTAGMRIDADGSPRAYHPVSDSGEDALANAGQNGKWWGIVTQRDTPVTQGINDPAPGFYISQTSLEYAGKRPTDPARYVNSDSIPYIVIPYNGIMFRESVLGDVGKIINLRNGKSCYAICADTGPRDKIGEGSIYLARQLGINSSPRNGGAEDSVSYVVYQHSGLGKPLSRNEIDSIGRSRDTAGN